MTTKGYVNDFYRQFEELNKKLDKANNTISELSLTIYNLNLEIQKYREAAQNDKETIEKQLLEIERLKNTFKKHTCSSPLCSTIMISNSDYYSSSFNISEIM